MLSTHVKGFSLLELCISSSIVILVSLLGCASFAPLHKKLTVETATDLLMNDLNFARLSAIRYNTTVLLCPTLDGKKCHNQWGNHYIIVQTHTNGEHLILKHQVFKNATLTLKNSLNAPTISYNAVGFSKTQGTFTVQTEGQANQLVFLHSGRIRKVKNVSIDTE